jgi:hypothetical protein
MSSLPLQNDTGPQLISGGPLQAGLAIDLSQETYTCFASPRLVLRFLDPRLGGPVDAAPRPLILLNIQYCKVGTCTALETGSAAAYPISLSPNAPSCNGDVCAQLYLARVAPPCPSFPPRSPHRTAFASHPTSPHAYLVAPPRLQSPSTKIVGRRLAHTASKPA